MRPHEVNAVTAWRDRLAGRSPFDRSAAEWAVRQAYRDSGLEPPGQIMWADGPGEALRAVAFLRTPPRSLQRFATALMIWGSAIWVGLTVLVVSRVGMARGEVITFAATLTAFAIVVGSLRPIPLPPSVPPVRTRDELLARLLALIVLSLQIAYALALLHVESLPSGPAVVLAAILVALALGLAPGLLLVWRMERAYRALPASLRRMGGYAPVGWQMQRARDSAWAPLRRRLGLAGWSDPLPTRSRNSAHAVAFRDNPAGLFVPGATAVPTRLTRRRGMTSFLEAFARVFEPDGVTGAPPLHLDGIEDAPRACTVARAGTSGPPMTFALLAFHLDRLYPFRDVAVAVRPATEIALDVEDRLHCDHGPAIAWADGTVVHAWHGQPVDAALIEDEVPLTRARISLEGDPSRRSVLIERYGLGRYMLESGAFEYQRDECGALYRLDQRFDEAIVAVRLTNHSPEPDGTYREFWLRIPPSTYSAREAVAWTFGLSPDEYDPIMQS